MNLTLPVDAALAYWGKARPKGQIPSHPAAYHCLDVAACAQVLLARNQQLREMLCSLLKLDAEQCSQFLTAFIALHDVGKYSRPFQAKAPQFAPEGNAYLSRDTDPAHGTAGLLLWRDHLAADLMHRMPNAKSLFPIARAIYGHHGSPVEEKAVNGIRAIYGSAGQAAAMSFARKAVELLMPNRTTLTLSLSEMNRASFAIAGFTVLADWLGSSQHHFPYEAPNYSLAEYWQLALTRAVHAVGEAGLLPVPNAPVGSYRELTGSQWPPSDMQTWAATCKFADGPALYIIEDATGSGKTEAALMLAHRLNAAGMADGIYLALPTMATADGLYDRVAKIYRRMFDGEASLVLSHGARALHEGFRASILGHGEGRCAQWLADDRRKAFLAQVGVGTVDQCLLSVLPSKHQSLRLIGLAQRVLVLDEVHAYDAYMSQEIETLLRFHAALGGSTILLSATLPADTKRRLAATYNTGIAPVSTAYPLATVVSAAGTNETLCAPRSDTIRDVPLTFVTDPEDGLARARAAANDGQAVLYIRNSVADAMEARDEVPGSLLFHARFAMCDRLAIQSQVLETFGRNSTQEQRRGRLLIATQVVEQSLDLDFDLIVSDLAPVDLIIQRGGRLWRHTRQRPAGAHREMIVVGPEPDADANAQWLMGSLRRTSFVYGDHARMWLTAQILRSEGMISAPTRLRPMIEHVYAQAPNVPQGLQAALAAQATGAGVNRGRAASSVLRLVDGYSLSTPWLAEDRIQTRLAAPSTTIRLAVIRNGRIIPWASLAHEGEQRRLWALSEVKIPSYRISGESISTEHTALVAAAKALWPAWEREPDGPVLVILTEDGDVWRGQASNATTRKRLTYSRTRGLE